MKIQLQINWFAVLHKIRILMLVGIFYALYHYTSPVFAFMFAFYFIYSDLTDIESYISETNERGDASWKNTWHKRKPF
ncbi:hypothetical protein COM24_07615 [Bacillus toyonensis]|uniref:Uncharacterized protein n=1 Tax=Bacillus thuringiensis TaxID=1428 RepID=A0A9X7BSY8_BACTU|nr:hypothetical protein [Bacillus tropicus]PES55987.1 hypothetical protein CN499_06060 [Bacillus thuringiensis]PGC56670.1 hypothetical protein COM24_07615 [Bacillus toyonensis]PGV22963.1 hypothetical protein COD93_29290 [Bacillus cereus]MCU5224103.1 hypothetical protein [Bacillus tropicus]PFV35693.1 hypothetical protein COK99_01340 [Bacillus thuringiensis]